MRVLGISAYYHDSAAALIDDGKVIAAAQEERFTRKKHDSDYPKKSIDYCLKAGGITADELDYVVFYDKPLLKFERLLESHLAFAPRGFTSFARSMPVWIREKLFQKDMLLEKLRDEHPEINWKEKLLFAEHHQSHAASAFFPSPFQSAAILTMDGVGEWATTSLAFGIDNRVSVSKEIHFPHSLGLLYSAFTYYTGFKVNSGEYKLMGLAPYGEPRYVDRIYDHLVDVKPDGSFRLNLEYFAYCTDLKMTNEKFNRLFDSHIRMPEQKLEQIHMDLAASIQKVTEEIVLKLGRSIALESGSKNLCLAGGVALNCVANGRLLRQGDFENIWIQPASGDAGGALGAALAAYYQALDMPRSVHDGKTDSMQGAYLGPEFEQSDIESRLRNLGAKFEVLTPEKLIERTAKDLAESKAVGWFQGRMEFGPRALGNRSILGDARSPKMQSLLNLKVKFRESFRPFAPAVLREKVSDWFELDEDSPYMLFVAEVKKDRQLKMSREQESLFGIEKLNVSRSDIPAVTHIDYSARIQTVHSETNPTFHRLLQAFEQKTGCPILVNTSFNIRGEPIVGSPEDAFRCFMGTDIDCLSIGNCYLKKETQDPALKKEYQSSFELD